MKRTFGLFLILIFSSIAFGQTAISNNQPSTTESQKESKNIIPVIECDLPGITKPNDLEKRVNAFYTALTNDPKARGFIINYGTDKEIKRRISRIKQHIKLHRFDLKRAAFIRGSNKAGIATRFFVLAEGEELPESVYSFSPKNDQILLSNSKKPIK